MKIMTVLGTRPEIIRLCLIIEGLDQACQHRLVFTGQNVCPALSSYFFKELGVREPDYRLEFPKDGFGSWTGRMLAWVDTVLAAERPDRLLVLGDTDSGLAVLAAKRQGVQVYHLEAGNRCYDDQVPEEANRRVIDHASDVLMPYTERSRQNLLREGIDSQRIYVVGNPIGRVIREKTGPSTIRNRLGFDGRSYLLATFHRAENVDVSHRLNLILKSLERVVKETNLPCLVSTHPHTRKRLTQIGVLPATIQFLDPFGLTDFVDLERHAACILTDSGTVQEEACILGIPSVILRDVTERPETVECGSTILAGVQPDAVAGAVRFMMNSPRNWPVPEEYRRSDTASTVIRILLGTLK